MENIICTIICIAAFLPAFIMTVIDTMHMYQLNSYKPTTQKNWLKKNPPKFLIPLGAGSLLAFCPLIPSPVWRTVVWTLILGVAAFFCVPQKAKKPLVYTPRVKRMLATLGVLTALIIILSLSLINDYYLFVIAILFSLSSVSVIAADYVNKPMEKAINNHYTNDAKNILEQCRPHLKVIGITGSYGKTSVKYFLTSLLKAKYNVLMTPESYNTPMGVVKTIRGSLRSTHDIFVCEMGARWEGDIEELCDIVHPDHGIITSIGPQHLESFGSLDVVKKTKFELADALPQDGLLFLNGTDKNIRDHGCNRPFVSYGLGKICDYTAYNLEVTSNGTSFEVRDPAGNSYEYSTKLIGVHNVLNVTGAIAVANTLGIPMEDLRGPVRKLQGVEHRLQLIERNGISIIDDAYNANPSGTKAALEALSLFDGYKIIVTPGMVELGEKQTELNREFGRDISKVCDFVVLVGEKQAKPIRRGLTDEGYDEDRIFVASTIQEALSFVYALSSDGQQKIVLLENDLPDNY